MFLNEGGCLQGDEDSREKYHMEKVNLPEEKVNLPGENASMGCKWEFTVKFKIDGSFRML